MASDELKLTVDLQQVQPVRVVIDAAKRVLGEAKRKTFTVYEVDEAVLRGLYESLAALGEEMEP